MTKDEALKMAIEALEMHVPYYIKDKGCDALIACKEALEQPNMTYEDGFAHGYEAHRAEQALEQPKEPQYLYVYQAMGGEVMIESKPSAYCGDCIGKIKLEVDDD